MSLRDVTNECVGPIAKGAKLLVKNTTLRELNLASNYIGNAGVKALMANNMLTTLFVANNHIDIEGTKVLSEK